MLNKKKCWNLFAFLCLATPLDYSIAGDWLRFRGPNGSGVCSDSDPTPVKWSDTENVKWRVELSGPGFSSPIVAGQHVYVTCWTGYGAHFGVKDQTELKRHLICVDRASGKQIWSKSIDATLPEDRYSGVMAETGYASHTPVSDGSNVYVFFGKSGVLGFDSNGNQLWQTSVGSGLNSPRYGSGSSPIIFENQIIISAGAESNSIVALDKRTGKEIWRQKTDGFHSTYASPILAQVDSLRSDLVVAPPGELWGLNPNNGKLRWFCKTFESIATCNSPIATEDSVFFFKAEGSALSVKAGGKDDVTNSLVNWRNDLVVQIGTPVVFEGLIYWVAHNIAHCVDASSGEIVKQTRLPPVSRDSVGDDRRFSRRNYASPIVADRKIYWISRPGICFVFAVGKEMQLLSQNRFAEDKSSFGATPAASNGELFIRSNSYLYCISAD